MNVEELKQLKEQLEKARAEEKTQGEQKYVIVDDIAYPDFDSLGKPMSENEILNQVNTDEVVKKLENFVEKAVRVLVENDCPFNYLAFCSKPGVVVTEKSQKITNVFV